MIFEIALAIFLGFLFGTLTGLIPGIHTNLISIVLLSLSTTLLIGIAPLSLAIFIVAMATTHTFLDFIPSIYLGAPDEDTALSVLPGHKYLLRGKAHDAVKLTLIGSIISIILLVIIAPLFFFALPISINIIERMMSWILIWISIFIITDTKNKSKSIIIFILAGFLGFASLNMNINQPLFPLLTGLFGTSTIINSINLKTQPLKQKITRLEIEKKDLIKPIMATTIVSPVCSLLPGLGSSQAAIISSKITGKLTTDQFMILLGSINTLVLTTSFFTLFLINKSRTGAASAISQLINLTPSTISIIILTIIIAAALSIPTTILFSKKLAKNLHKINYQKISKVILIILILLTLSISGFTGILILVISTSLGLLCVLLEVRKSILMGCLLIPTILFYFPF